MADESTEQATPISQLSDEELAKLATPAPAAASTQELAKQQPKPEAPSLSDLTDEQLAGLAQQTHQQAAQETRQGVGEALSTGIGAAGIMPAPLAEAMLTKGGKVGDFALNTVLPIGGAIAGTIIGGAAATPETAGAGTIPGAVAGAKVGGGIGGGLADAITQARQFIRGERDNFSLGSLAASTAVGAFIPKPIAEAGSIPATIVKTALNRGVQGELLATGHTAATGLIDNGKVNTADLLESAKWGPVFGLSAGLIEGAAGPAFKGLLQSIHGKTPEEAKPIIQSAELPDEFKARLQEKIDADKAALGAKMQEKVAAGQKAGAEAQHQDFIEQEMGGINKPGRGTPGTPLPSEVTVAELEDRTADAQAKLANEATPNEIRARDFEKARDEIVADAQQQLEKLKSVPGEALAEKTRLLRVIDENYRPEAEPPGPQLSAQAQRMADEYGFVSPKVAMSLAGGAVGGVVGSLHEGTPQQKLEYALAYGGIGAFLGLGSGTALETFARGGGLKQLGALTDYNVLKGLWAARKIDTALTYTHDAVPIKAKTYGGAAGHEITDLLTHAVPKAEVATADNALPFVVEAKGDRNALNTMLGKIAMSKDTLPKVRMQAMEAIQYAQANWAKLAQIAQLHGLATDTQALRENANGVFTPHRDGYVMHAWDLTDPEATPIAGGPRSGSSTGFKMERKYETLADGIAAGEDPKTLAASALMQARFTAGEMAIGRGQWIEAMKAQADPLTGKPIVVSVKPGESVPRDYTLQQVGNRTFALSKNFSDVFNQLNNPSWWTTSPGLRAAQKVNATGKSISLGADTFHAVRVALMEAVARGFNFGSAALRGENPLPTLTTSGLRSVYYNEATLSRMVQRGELSPAQFAQAITDRAKIEKGINAGFMLGGVEDAMHQDWVRSFPVVGAVNRGIFDVLQRRAMMDVYLMELQRRSQIYGANVPDTIYRETAQDVNTWFRSFGSQGWFRSATAKDMARFLMFAPQWFEGGVRTEIGAVGQAAKALGNYSIGRRQPVGLLAGGAGTAIGAYFAANQIINHYTRGHPTWENPEEGMGAKLSAWVPDYAGRLMGKEGPGFFLNPTGLAGETTHALVSMYEKTDSWAKTLKDYAMNRSSTILRGPTAFATQQDPNGQHIKTDDLFAKAALAEVPAPIPAHATMGLVNSLISGQPQQATPGEFQGRIMSTFGIKADHAPSATQRIGALAHNFKIAHGIEADAEFNGSDYQDLKEALITGNKVAANKAIDDLLTKHTPAQMIHYFRGYPAHPATGKMRTEGQFVNSLTTEQRQQYHQSRIDKLTLSRDALRALQQRLVDRAKSQSKTGTGG